MHALNSIQNNNNTIAKTENKKTRTKRDFECMQISDKNNKKY